MLPASSGSLLYSNMYKHNCPQESSIPAGFLLKIFFQVRGEEKSLSQFQWVPLEEGHILKYSKRREEEKPGCTFLRKESSIVNVWQQPRTGTWTVT